MKALGSRAAIFYNVENLFDTVDHPNKRDEDFTPKGSRAWDKQRYQLKLERIAEVLSLFHSCPAFVGLAEVENRTVLEDLLRQPSIADIDYGIAHFESPDRRGIDCALCYDKAVFSLSTSRKLSVGAASAPHFVTRDILHVEGQVFGGIEMHFFVNHWSSRREGQKETEPRRIRAAKVLRQAIDRVFLKNPSANIVVMGDFNDYPDNKSLSSVLAARSTAHIDAESSPSSEKEEHGMQPLVNLLYDEHLADEGTAVHKREWGVLDQIIVSQALYRGESGLGLVEQDAEILRIEKLLHTYRDGGQKPNATFGGRKYHGGYSDHLPVYIGLTTLKQRKVEQSK